MIRIGDLFFALRPVLLIPVWGFSLFGYAAATGYGAPYDVSFPDFGIMLLFSLVVASVYVCNQIADRKTDALNDGYALLANSVIGLKTASFLAIISAAIGISGCFLVSVPIGILSLLGLLLGLVYSFKPTYFTGRPVADFLSNSIGWGYIAFGVGYVLADPEFSLTGLLRDGLPYVLMMAAGSISSTIPDIKGDKKTGKITTAVKLGARAAHLLAMVFLFAAVALGFAFDQHFAVLSSIAAIPFYVAYALIVRRGLQEATYKVGGAISMLCAAYVYMPFAVVSLLLFALTWLYFKLRFGVAYPTLVAE